MIADHNIQQSDISIQDAVESSVRSHIAKPYASL